MTDLKFFATLVGGIVWLVTSKGRRPRRYFLTVKRR
jgi:hypothetical protein